MVLTRHIVSVFLAGLIALAAAAVSSQDYPNKPIRLVTTTVGSGSDYIARVIAQEISAPLGQPVIVENRSGTLPSVEAVAKAAPDGYNLLVAGGTFRITPLLQKTTYDPINDFSPITLTEMTVNVLAVHPSLPVRSVKELIALAKARPGDLNYASGQTGSSGHLAAELFKAMAHVNIVRVPYRGGAQALNDLVAGEVQMMFGNSSSLFPHAKLGRLKVLAVTSARPSALAPGLPTLAGSGLPGYESVSLTAMFAPAKTPATIINRLNQEIVRSLNKQNIKERYFSIGVETIGSSPEELAAAVKSDMTKMGKVIKDAGIKGD